MTDTPEPAVVVLAQGKVASEEADITALVLSAEELRIATDDELQASSALLTSIKGRQKALSEIRLSITRPMDEAKKRVMEVFQPAVERLGQAEATLKRAVLTYTQERARKLRDEQAQLEVAAEREREHLRKEAELQRKAGHEVRAEASEQLAETLAAPAAEAPVSTAGVHVRTTWRAEVVDMAALAKACADGLVSLELIEANMLALNARAREQKERLAIPGVRAVSEQGVSARA